MTRPLQISLEVKYDADGIMDESSLITQLEKLLEGRIRITDWVGERAISEEYKHLDEEQRRSLISSIDIGDFDDAINLDVRRKVLDEAATSAGVPVSDSENDDDYTPRL
jgi:hypothetical protein